MSLGGFVEDHILDVISEEDLYLTDSTDELIEEELTHSDTEDTLEIDYDEWEELEEEEESEEISEDEIPGRKRFNPRRISYESQEE